MGKVKTATQVKARSADRSETPVKTGVTRVMAVTSRISEMGICSTCRHQPRCLFVRATRRPIQHCEEFDNGGSARASLPEAAGRPNGRGINLEQGQALGICTNCDTRLTCMHRKPGETVLDCEDYS